MEKNNVLKDFKEMTVNSWTYKKMTAEEQIRLFTELDSVRLKEALKGTYKQRWNVLQAFYGAFLAGLGYDGFNWREDEYLPF